METSVVKKYYEGLGEHRILATRCAACNGLTFPPTSMCEHCGSASVEWEELSGRGTLMYVSQGIAPPPNPRFVDVAPYSFGHVKLDEDVYVQGIVTDITPEPEVLAEFFVKGPVAVTADIIEVDGLPILAFKTA